MHADSAVLNYLSGRVIGCAFTVLNTLGAGFLEKVYENALAIEMREAGLAIMQRHAVRVLYHDMVVGEYFPDLLVEAVCEDDDDLLALLNDKIRAVPGVSSTDTFTYLKICKETYTWGTR